MRKMLSLSIVFTGLTAGTVGGAGAFNLFSGEATNSVLATEKGKIAVTRVAGELRHPWGMVFLPDGRMLVTERRGKVIRYITADGKKSEPLAGMPEILFSGQGGLFDVVLDPDFANNRLIYFSYNEPEGSESSTAVARAKLQENSITDLTVIFRQQPRVDSGQHFGGRLVFNPDGTLFITLGERGQRSKDAQTLDTHLGKVVRIRPDGSVPPDNPFVKDPKALAAIWSYGHRNVQGAALHPQTGLLWTHEHGPQGGDEINVARPGKNYGWPTITYGERYGGGKIGETAQEGLEQPLYYWVPSIAPGGMSFYTGSLFPAWNNNLLVSSLKFGELVRLELQGEKVVHEERIEIGQRVRDVRQGPDGSVYLLTDEYDGQLLRLTPASTQ